MEGDLLALDLELSSVVADRCVETRIPVSVKEYRAVAWSHTIQIPVLGERIHIHRQTVLGVVHLHSLHGRHECSLPAHLVILHGAWSGAKLEVPDFCLVAFGHKIFLAVPVFLRECIVVIILPLRLDV